MVKCLIFTGFNETLTVSFGDPRPEIGEHVVNGVLSVVGDDDVQVFPNLRPVLSQNAAPVTQRIAAKFRYTSK